MLSENLPNTTEQPLKEKQIPILSDREKGDILEKLSGQELLDQEEKIKREITSSRRSDRQTFVAKNGNIDLQNSISEQTLQLNKELSLISKAIENKAKTIGDVAKYHGTPPTDKDIADLYRIFMPDTKFDNLQARLSFRDSIVRRTSSFPKRDGSKIPILNLDELMNCIELPISKNDNRYTKYQQIIAVLFIEGVCDETQFTGEDTKKRELAKEISRLPDETNEILNNILTTQQHSDDFNTDIIRSLKTTSDIISIIANSRDYAETKQILEGDDYGLTISQEQYTSLVTNAKEVIKNADENTKRAQKNQDAQVAALKKGNLVEAVQQETKYQRETSQIEYYRDLRSSLSKTEGNQISNTIPTSKNNINVGGSDFSTKLTYFMNDERTNSIYPKLSDGTTIPIIKAGDDVYIVQGCQVPADEVEGLVKLNQTLAEKGLRFFSIKSPLTKILTNIEQTLRTKGVQNVPHFGDLKNVSTYQDNIVDILYALIDPDPKTPAENVNERINLTSKRLKNGIPLIAHGRQSGIVKEDSSINLDKIAEKLTTMVQSGYPFLFGGSDTKGADENP